jgi:transcriptional regulator with XRE-family HTH domain
MNSKRINKKEEILKQFERFLTFQDDTEKLEFEASKIHLDFIDELLNMMEEQKMTKSELADKLGTSKSYITQLFSGDKLINLLLLAKIQRVFKTGFNILPGRAPVYAKEFREKIRKDGYLLYQPGVSSDFIKNCPKKAS